MANSMKFGFALGGFKEIDSLLRQLPAPLREKVIPALMGDVGKEIVAAARAFAPRRTGALKRSITWVVRKGRGKDKSAYVVVGPDKRFYKSGKRLNRREDGADRPAKYAHLVEYGTATTAGKPFLRPAFMSKRREMAQIAAAGIAAGIKKEVARLRRKGAKRGITIA
jgi:HK97 gp10 family phage protein